MNIQRLHLLLALVLAALCLSTAGCAGLETLLTELEQQAATAQAQEASADLQVADAELQVDNSGPQPNFRMLLASDSQYPWTNVIPSAELAKHPDMITGVEGESRASTESKSLTLNERHVKSMNLLATHFGDVYGTILNGDLTAYGHAKEMDVYREIYDQLNVRLYPGLGNHDYANNVDGTWENRAATGSIEYLKHAVKELGITHFDLKETDSYEFPELVTSYVGSLAYSWTVGNVHFVQLNNYPTYTTSWSNFRSDRARRIKVEIKEALTWLENDLIDARNLGRAIVINMHDAHEHFAHGPDRQRFIDMIEKYGVSAIFAGHIHESLGRGTPVGTVPMFYCGSSAYSKYLAVSFFDNEMTLQGVDSSSADEPGYVKLGSWVRGSLDRQALNTTVPATPFPPVPKDGRVTFFNEGGYVARFTLTYQLDGKQVKHETGNLALGNKRTYNIPGRATGVRAVGECKTGLIWNPWANIFNVSYSPPPTVCLKAYGTTLSPKYNTNCD